MISDSELTALRTAVDGPVLTAGDAEYAAAAAGYNLAVVHEPEVIVVPSSTADVVATIGWAAEHGLPVAVQATGHGATELMTDGVLINTRLMQDVRVDREGRTGDRQQGGHRRHGSDHAVSPDQRTATRPR